VWKFFNINLPDSNTNEPLSHGYIEFSISPYQPLPDGTPVTNSANIYFDFNPPVITNTTVNMFQTTIVSIGELPSEQQLFVYPVPVDDIINIKPEINSAGPIVLELYDIAGKKITTLYEGNFIPGQVISKDLSELNAGVYLLQLMHSGNVSVTKILIE
jgi:hypothetical protein